MRTLLFSSLLLLSLSASALGIDHMAVLSHLDDSYARTHVVPLDVRNVTPKLIRFYAYIEVYDRADGWVPWSFDMETGELDTIARIYPLKPGQSGHVFFDVSKARLPPIPLGHTAKIVSSLRFRFHVVLLHSTDDARLGELHSKIFRVLDPFAQSPHSP